MRNIQAMVQEALANAEQEHRARLGSQVKTASEEQARTTDTHSYGDVVVETELVVKTADGLRRALQLLGHSKEAMTPAVGGGDRARTTETIGIQSKQNAETGQHVKQPPHRPDEKGNVGPTNIPASNEQDAKKHMRGTQPVLTKGASAAALKSFLLNKQAGSGPQPKITEATLPQAEGVSKAGEGPTASGSGASLVASIKRAIDYTKGDAKALVKPELSKLLGARPLSKKDDPVLHNSFRSTSKAGVKIAAVRDVLGLGKEGN